MSMRKFNLAISFLLAFSILFFGCVSNQVPPDSNLKTDGQQQIQQPANNSVEKKADQIQTLRNQTPPIEQNKTTSQVQTEKIPEPPSGTISVYKGFWMPCGFLSDDCQPMSDLTLFKSTGANIAFFAVNVKINKNGEARLDVPMEYVDIRMGELAEKYYSNGIRLGIVVDSQYVEDFSDSTPAGGPPRFPSDVASKPGLTDMYDGYVVQIAKLAEKYNADIFSPMNEPDYKFGNEVASKWGQQILPSVRENYKGLVFYKAAMLSPMKDNANLDFKGYDIIGIDITPSRGVDVYDDELKSALEYAFEWAHRDNVPYVMFTEFGIWGGAMSLDQDERAVAHRLVFEAGNGYVNGFIALDPPPDLDKSIKGTKTLDEITKWFKQNLTIYN